MGRDPARSLDGERTTDVEISPSLFDIEESSQVSRERVEQLKQKLLRRYREKTEEREEMRKKDQPAERKEQAG